MLLVAVHGLGIRTLEVRAVHQLLGDFGFDARQDDVEASLQKITAVRHAQVHFEMGFGRVMGTMRIDDVNPTKSSVDLQIYPAMSMTEPLEEDGKFKSRWLANRANHTMLCFHSKNVVRTSGGRVQTTGDLILVRVDRNVEVPAPNEAYSGPVYGSPITHRVSHEATLVLDLPADASGQKDGGIEASAYQGVSRRFSSVGEGEAYSGATCTGTFLQGPSLPEDPGTHIGEDYPGPQNFNAQVGERLNLVIMVMHCVS
jgi:polyisoprenoid-binding protein YceI